MHSAADARHKSCACVHVVHRRSIEKTCLCGRHLKTLMSIWAPPHDLFTWHPQITKQAKLKLSTSHGHLPWTNQQRPHPYVNTLHNISRVLPTHLRPFQNYVLAENVPLKTSDSPPKVHKKCVSSKNCTFATKDVWKKSCSHRWCDLHLQGKIRAQFRIFCLVMGASALTGILALVLKLQMSLCQKY